MRICINVEREGDLRLIEEDVELALGKLLGTVFAPEYSITDQGDGCFTADTTNTGVIDEQKLREAIHEDTGAEVTVEVIEDYNRGY